MKIRQGFVSNSSSSSFIVMIKDPWEKKKSLSKKKIKILEQYHFCPCSTPSPINLEMNEGCLKSAKIDDKTYYLGISVNINEDDVIQYLIENKIPFKGAGHYGHYSIFWDGKADYVLKIENMGLSYEMYEDSYKKMPELFDNKKPLIQEIPLKEWLEMENDYED